MLQRLHSSTLERGFALAGAAGVVSGLVLIKYINPTNSSWLPVCPLYAMTGLSCPGCGGTRGMHSLLNGDVVTALGYNVLLVVFVPLIIYGLISLILLGVRGRGLPYPKRYAAHAAFGFLFLMLTFGVLRNLPFYPFTILAP